MGDPPYNYIDPTGPNQQVPYPNPSGFPYPLGAPYPMGGGAPYPMGMPAGVGMPGADFPNPNVPLGFNLGDEFKPSGYPPPTPWVPTVPSSAQQSYPENSDRRPSLPFQPYLPPVANEQPPNSRPSATISETEALSRIRDNHDSMMLVLTNRAKKLNTVKDVWNPDNLLAAFNVAIYMKEKEVLVDLLCILLVHPKLWTIDLSVLLLPHLMKLLEGKHDYHLEVACKSVKLIVDQFYETIRHNLKAPASSAVDLQREERVKKCKSCLEHLLQARHMLKQQPTLIQRAGSAGRELNVALDKVMPPS